MFERQDWELFRTVDGLSHKAGVPRQRLAALVAKELVDNALDESGACKISTIPNGFLVTNKGPGIDPTQVADLFSIKRPLRSTKLLRLPSRGALGNGLRVVAGAVLATGGSLKVYTRGQVMNLIPRPDGTTTVESIQIFPLSGTGVYVELGQDAGSINPKWAQRAILLAKGQHYKGKTSPWWYSSRDFYELCLAAKDMTVSDLVSMFEACANKTGSITSGFKGKQASDVSLDEARTLLDRMRAVSVPVNPNRLGSSNTDELEDLGSYVKDSGTFAIRSDCEVVEIPFVIEAWTTLTGERAAIAVHVNRTPVTSEVGTYHSKTEMGLFNCGLSQTFAVGRRPPQVWLNIITPYMPITTDGKAPDLSVLADEIVRTITRSVNKAKRESPKGATNSQKAMVLAHLAEAIGETGGGNSYRQRQLFYVVRRIVSHLGGGVLLYGNFTGIITDYESEIGHDLPGMYRDDRGTLYHPHLGEQISLGSVMVERYVPPAWTFHKVLYIEKEGFYGILRAAKWPERHDCALLTSKGQATRAAKDLIDMLGDGDEEITFYCAHDADAAGTVIYEALQEATKARPARKVRIVNIGLEPEEGLAMGLEPEAIDPLEDGRRRAVADYVSDEMTEWLQTNRVELNAMTTPQFLKWLDDKVGDEKLIPPESVMVDELNEQAETKLKEAITDQILKDQDLDGQVRTALEAMKPAIDEKAKDLPKVIVDTLEDDPAQSWRDPVEKIVEDLVAQREKTTGPKETT